MQIAGVDCNVCGKRVPSEAQGAGCLACDLVFHRACLENEGHCAQCGASFDEQAAKADLDEREKLAARRGRGRLLLWVVTIGLVALSAVTAVFVWSAERWLITYALLDVAVIVILLMLLHAGTPAARKLLILIMGVSAVVDLWKGPVAVRIAGGLLAVMALVIAYSSDVALVFGERARARGYRIDG